MFIAHRRPWTLLPLALVLAVSACGGDDDDTGDGDGTMIDASANDASDGTLPDASTGSPDASKDEPDGSVVKVCGTLAGVQCDDDEYCDYTDDSCGNADGASACVPRPDVCGPEGPPVCGCNGESYDSKCEAAQAGTDVAQLSICTITAGHDPL